MFWTNMHAIKFVDSAATQEQMTNEKTFQNYHKNCASGFLGQISS